MSVADDSDILYKIKNDSLATCLDNEIGNLKLALESRVGSMSNEDISCKVELVRSNLEDFTSLSYKKYYNRILDEIKAAYLGVKVAEKNNF